jgi:cytochrome c553
MVNRFMALVLMAVFLSPFSEAASRLQSETDAVLRRKPDMVAGEQKYQSACSACHGTAGGGQPQGRAPRIAGQRYTVIASQLVGFRLGRRMDGQMQARASDHVLRGSQDIADVAAYAAQLRLGWAAQGPGNLLEAGALVYVTRCMACHGVGAVGSDQPAVPRLATQNYDYLVRQLRDFVEGRRPAAGRHHLQYVQSLDQEQIAGLADYLSRLP